MKKEQLKILNPHTTTTQKKTYRIDSWLTEKMNHTYDQFQILKWTVWIDCNVKKIKIKSYDERNQIKDENE